MKIFSWQWLTQFIMQFLIVQLFLTLISLPILVSWGLPLSALSPVGNLLFSPFLTLFLLLSSIIFFTQMIALPNELFIWLLEKLTVVWHYLLGFSSQSAMYAFRKPPLIILIIIPIVSLFLVRHPRLRAPKHKLAGLCAMSLITWTVLSIALPDYNWIKAVPCNRGFVTLIHQNNKTMLIDPGVIGQRISAPSWIAYTLIPEITKLTGSLTIDTVVCTKLGKVQFDALQTLGRKMNINTLYLPGFNGELEPHIKRSFNRFYATIRSQNTRIVRTYRKPIHINDRDTKIIITPEKKLAYRSITYTRPTVSAFVDNRNVPIYSPKKS